MRLTAYFPSFTNLQWFETFLVEDFPELLPYFKTQGTKVILDDLNIPESDLQKIEGEMRTWGAAPRRSGF